MLLSQTQLFFSQLMCPVLVKNCVGLKKIIFVPDTPLVMLIYHPH